MLSIAKLRDQRCILIQAYWNMLVAGGDTQAGPLDIKTSKGFQRLSTNLSNLYFGAGNGSALQFPDNSVSFFPLETDSVRFFGTAPTQNKSA